MSEQPEDATNRHRPDELSGERGRDPRARGALIALAVAAVGTVGFVVGLRVALQKAPAERAAVAGDSARARAEYDSVTAARRRSAPRAPTADTSGREDLPRLR